MTVNKKSLIKNYLTSDIIKWKKKKIFFIKHPIIREIPLRIFINKSPCVTLMYTPGQEKELAVGYCFTEGILPDFWDGKDLQWDKFNPKEGIISFNLDQPVQLHSAMALDSNDFSENSNDEPNTLNRIRPYLKDVDFHIQISCDILQNIEKQIRQKQKLFALTGATHGACIFDCKGNYLYCCEDIARHNALDKAIGYAILNGIVLSDKILCLTGRTNYTLIRKAVRAQFPMVASVSAPTSMAVEISKAVGLTLVGFLRAEEMSIYAGHQRIKELLE